MSTPFLLVNNYPLISMVHTEVLNACFNWKRTKTSESFKALLPNLMVVVESAFRAAVWFFNYNAKESKARAEVVTVRLATPKAVKRVKRQQSINLVQRYGFSLFIRQKLLWLRALVNPFNFTRFWIEWFTKKLVRISIYNIIFNIKFTLSV